MLHKLHYVTKKCIISTKKRFMNLDKYILKDIKRDDHPSDFIKRDNLFGLILRLPKIENSVIVKSYSFLVDDSTVYFYNRDNKELEKFGTLDSMQQSLEQKIEKLTKEIKQYHIYIDKLEDSLYEGKQGNNFMQEWLLYKKSISLVNRLMFHASIAVGLFISHLKKENINYNKNSFDDLKEAIDRVHNLTKSGVEKLDYLYDFYRVKVDEKMNKNVYYLTLLSGIFLPLTLLTGFFGMNTGGLPYTQDPLGTWKVIGISVILEIIFFLPFIVQNMKKIKRFNPNSLK